MQQDRWRHPVLFFVFFLSGAASLVYQVVWQRMLTLVFGNTVYATTTVLASFLGGLALGSYLLGKRADRIRNPVRFYAVLEGAVGLLAAASPFGFRILDGFYADIYQALAGYPVLFPVVRFVLASLLLLPPTVLMGATLPVMSRYFVKSLGHLGFRVGALYTVNTLGAVVGCFGAGFFLILALGLKKTIFAAALANGLIFCLALAVSRGGEVPVGAGAERGEEGRRKRGTVLAAVIFLCGLSSIGFEVLWTRILVFHLGSSVYSYALMLTLFLVGFSAGSFLAARFADRVRRRIWMLAAVEIALGLTVLLQIRQFVSLTELIGNVGAYFDVSTYWGTNLVYFLAAIQVLILPTCLMGMTFPLVAKEYVSGLARVGGDIGRLYAANTAGCIVGAVVTGFALVPLLGTQRSLVALASVNLAAAALVLWSLSGLRRSVSFALTAGVYLVLFLPYVLSYQKDSVLLSAGLLSMGGEKQVIYYYEDASATVTVENVSARSGEKYRSLSVNGINVAGTSPDLVAIQKMQGHLPLLMHPNPESVLHIGFGSGGTAWSVFTHGVKKIVIAEITKGVLSASDRYFEDMNHGILRKPGIAGNIHIMDGRNFLAGVNEKFDVILSDSIHPRYAGNGSLYTLDYYRLCRERLNPGGILSQWLPLYSLSPLTYKMILRSFTEVFPNTTVWYVHSHLNPYTIVIGSLGPERIDHERIAAGLTNEAVRRDLGEIGVTDPYGLYEFFLFGGAAARRFADGVPFHTDDYPAVEYLAGKLRERERPWYENFRELLTFRESILPELDPSGDFDRERVKSLMDKVGPRLEQQLDMLGRYVRRVESGGDTQ